MKKVSLAQLSSKNLSWVVAQLRPNMLLKACKHLENQNFEYFAPTRFETINAGNGFKRIERLLFPGYIFVRCDVDTKDLSALKATIGLSRVVRGMGDGPGIIPDGFMEELNRASDLSASTRALLKQGDMVRVIDGPFVGMVGEILNADSNGRLRVLFDVMAGVRPMVVKSSSVEVRPR